MATPNRIGKLASISLVPASMILALAAMLCVQIAAPHYLTNHNYSNFTTLWSVAQFISVLMFEWLRVSTLRFSHADGTISYEYYKALKKGYAGVAATGASIILATLLLSNWLPAAAPLSAILAFAVAKGCFDGQQALFRAGDANVSYAVSWGISGGLSLALFVLTASHYGEAYLALMGLAVSYCLSLIAFRLFKKRNLEREPAQDASIKLRTIFKYGIYISVAAVSTALFPAVVRLGFIFTADTSALGGSLLAIDLSQRAIFAVGMIINLVVLQKSIRLYDRGQASDSRKVQLYGTTAIILPAAIGYFAVNQQIASLLVPSDFTVAFNDIALIAVTSSALMALRTYAIDPIFIVAKKTHLAIWGTVVSIIVQIGTTVALSVLTDFNPLTTLSAALIASSLLGIATSLTLAFKFADLRIDISTSTLILATSAAMGLMIYQVEASSALVQLILKVLAGSIVYAALILAFGRRTIRALLAPPTP